MTVEPTFIVDACVLIDFLLEDSSIFILFSRHVGKICVVVDVLGEVEGLDIATCRRLGLSVVEPTTEQYREAGRRQRPQVLSFQDSLCLILARDNNWICVSNDKDMHRASGSFGVRMIRGFRMHVMIFQNHDPTWAGSFSQS